MSGSEETGSPPDPNNALDFGSVYERELAALHDEILRQELERNLQSAAQAQTEEVEVVQSTPSGPFIDPGAQRTFKKTLVGSFHFSDMARPADRPGMQPSTVVPPRE